MLHSGANAENDLIPSIFTDILIPDLRAKTEHQTVKQILSVSALHVDFPLQVSLAEHVVAELVRQLLLDLLHLAGFAVVAQRTRHLLIGHLFAIPFLDPPAMCQRLLVFGRKLECPFVSVHPPDTVLHVAVS